MPHTVLSSVASLAFDSDDGAHSATLKRAGGNQGEALRKDHQAFSSRPAEADGETALPGLLQLVASGDHVAFEELYRRTSAKLFGVCLRILQDRLEAEDALQTAYLSIWSGAGRYDESRASPMTWLITAARNRAIDRLRALRPIGLAPIEAAGALPSQEPIASEKMEVASDLRRLHICMEVLEPRDADLIRVSFLEGSTYAELASRSATPLGTIKSRIRRALLKLRECLD